MINLENMRKRLELRGGTAQQDRMIKDKLENATIYYNLSENLKKGFEWPNEDSLWECFNSEIEEFKLAIKKERLFYLSF